MFRLEQTTLNWQSINVQRSNLAQQKKNSTLIESSLWLTVNLNILEKLLMEFFKDSSNKQQTEILKTIYRELNPSKSFTDIAHFYNLGILSF